MDPQEQIQAQDPNQIDPVAVLNYIQEAGKTDPVVRLTLDNAMKSAYIDKQADIINRMQQLIPQPEEKTKLKEVRPS